MSEFQVLRYLKKWRLLIFIIAVIGSLAVYYYGKNSQFYTATVILEYTTDSAQEGLNPDGTTLDTSEITSASIITDVIESLGLRNATVESIRSGFTITSIIPEEEEARESAAIDQLEDYTYYPTSYQVSYRVGSWADEDYARDILDAVLTNYFKYYCEKYLDTLVFPNNAFNITTDDYEYLDCVKLLETNASTIISYLESKAEEDYNFYSASTGYSFTDLARKYQFLKDTSLTDLEAYILENRLALNVDVLKDKKANEIAQLEIDIENYKTHVEEAKGIIDQFGDKTLDGQTIYQQDDGGLLVVTDVEDNEYNNRNAITTYDQLINQYASLQAAEIDHEISLGQAQEILDIYSDTTLVNTDPDSPEAVYVKTKISEITEEFNELYELVIPTVDEYNLKNGADNINILCSIFTSESVNLNLYITLAVVLFLVVGCAVAIFFGRIGDFIDYYLYADKRTGLPNRERCDIEIDRYINNTLDDNFTCFSIKLQLRYPNDRTFKRETGDEYLNKFGEAMKEVYKNIGFAGYNNDGNFIAFAESFSNERAQSYVANFIGTIESSFGSTEREVIYQIGYATTTTEGIYEIRNLMREAIAKYKTNTAGKGSNQ